GPSVIVSDAMPVASVVTVVEASVPLASSENVTVTLGTAFPYWSTTLTVSADASGLPTAPLWLSPPTMTTLAGTSGVAVASTSSTGRLPTCAASVSVPATVPNVQFTV